MPVAKCVCGAKYNVPESAVGKKAQCEKCGMKFIVSASDHTPTTPRTRTAPSARIDVLCKCSKTITLLESTIGKTLRCPYCQNDILVERPKDPHPTPDELNEPDEPDELDEPDEIIGGGSLLDDLADQETTAKSKGPRRVLSASKPCPNCGHPMSPRDQNCLACGYTPTAQTARTKKPRSGKITKLALSAGSFLLGCACSALGALIGAAAWFAIAKYTGYGIGYIAWGIGILAGFGMAIGYRQQNVKAGIVAAGMSVAGIISAKAMIFIFVIYALFSGNTDDVNIQREIITRNKTEEILGKREAFSLNEREEQWDSAYAEAENQVSDLSDEQVRERWKEHLETQEELLIADQQERLADHHAQLLLREAGINNTKLDDDEYQTLFSQQLRKYQNMPPQQLGAAIEALDQWQTEGKWNDQKYARNYLIYIFIDQSISGKFADRNREELSDQDWNTEYDAAVARVDAMSPEQILAETKRIETEKSRKMEEAMAEFAKQFEGGQELTAEVIAAFFTGMFGFMDIIFIVFAVGTAYKIASGGSNA